MQQQKGRVVTLRSRHGHGHFAAPELARIARQERRPALVAGFGNEGLRHERTFCRHARPFHEKWERQRPCPHLGHGPFQRSPVPGNHRVFGAHGAAEHHVRTGFFGGLQLGLQVFHPRGKAGHIHGLEFAFSQCGFHIFQACLAISRGVGQHSHLGPAAFDDISHHERGLEAVFGRCAEHIALRPRVLGREQCAGGARDDERQACLLKHLQ